MSKKSKWDELCNQVRAVGFGQAPAGIARLAYACEIGDGIDQHAADDIWAMIDEIDTLREKSAHDAEMLCRDGDVLILALRYLGLDESGCDIQEIPEQIKRQRAEVQALRARVAELEARQNDDLCYRTGCNAPAVGEFYIFAGDTRLGSAKLCAKHVCEETDKRVTELEAQVAVVNVLAGERVKGLSVCANTKTAY